MAILEIQMAKEVAMKKPPWRAILYAKAHRYTRAISEEVPTRLYVVCMNLWTK
jgi:hypothetical protein